MNSQYFLFLIVCMIIIVNTTQAFAITESFLISSEEQKTFNIILDKNQKIFFQIFIGGDKDENIRLKIIDNNSNHEYFNSIIRAEKQDMIYDSTIFPAYKSEISNQDTNTKNLTFIF